MNGLAAAITMFVALLAFGALAQSTWVRHKNRARRQIRLAKREEFYASIEKGGK